MSYHLWLALPPCKTLLACGSAWCTKRHKAVLSVCLIHVKLVVTCGDVFLDALGERVAGWMDCLYESVELRASSTKVCQED
ncbi:hypothetical protein E2C01_056378 [Portunus trituberculatus]|uniref:Uncharacterized protein n=1 Tax=Portunus trituberculatus TaxID=210409 RepID=A0A5B7H0D4_PORTR|nr:hypothetical protein [Portunus trituberculatus]